MLLKTKKRRHHRLHQRLAPRYYDIPTGTLRREHLKRARSEGFAVPADSYREMLCERRFFRKKRRHCGCFFRAWTMIKASAAAGVSFSKKRQKKRTAHLHEGSLSPPDDLLPESADAVLIEEWQDFCAGTHLLLHREQSLLFDALGFVPIKDARWRKSSPQRSFW